jgi:hypothetical protein
MTVGVWTVTTDPLCHSEPVKDSSAPALPEAAPEPALSAAEGLGVWTAALLSLAALAWMLLTGRPSHEVPRPSRPALTPLALHTVRAA